MTRCGQFGQQRRHYGSSDGQTSPESLTISLVAGRPLETVQKHTSTPLAAKSQWRMAVFAIKSFSSSSGMLPSHMQHPFVDRYRDSHNASPRSLVDEDTMNPPSSGIVRSFYHKRQFVSTTTKRATIQLNLLEAESHQNFGQMRFDAVTAKLYKVEHVKSNLHNIASTLKLDNLVRT